MVILTRFVDAVSPQPPGLSLSDKSTLSSKKQKGEDQCDLPVVLYALPLFWGGIVLPLLLY